jgi:hypothetical protein
VHALADRYPFAPGSLACAADAPGLSGRYPQYREVLDWIGEFITRPDARVGRPGAVCPRVAPALEHDLVWLVAIPVTASSRAEAAETGIRLAGLFRDLFPQPEQARAAALLAIFPGLAPQRAGAFIDGGHTALRTRFTAAGLMLGGFHPARAGTAVRNPAFPVWRCPVPGLAVRAMSPHDLMFLDRPGPGETAVLAHYLRHIPHPPGAARLRARAGTLAGAAR